MNKPRWLILPNDEYLLEFYKEEGNNVAPRCLYCQLDIIRKLKLNGNKFK